MTDLVLIRRLALDLGRSHWRRYFAAFICMALVAGATALSAWLVKDVVNVVFIEKRDHLLIWIGAAIIAVFTVKGLATYGHQVILSRIANAIIAEVQLRVFAHILRFSVGYHASRHSADFIARQTFIARSAGSVLNILVTAAARDALTLVGLLIVMVVQDPLMSALAFLIMPVAVFGVRKLSLRARKVASQEFSGFTAAMETTQEAVQGIRMVKSFTLEPLMSDRQRSAVESIRRASNKLAKVVARSNPLMEALGGFAVAAVVLYGGWRVIGTGQTPGAFFSFIAALLLAYEPAKRLARINVDLSSSLVGVRMMYEFLDEQAEDQDTDGARDLVVTDGRVEFRDIVFSYRPDEPLFEGLTFVAEGGATTALVGSSGAGKSSVFSLLLRYWEPGRGQILIDGQDLRFASRRSLRRNIAYVGQDVFLFRGSIRENIALGREDADDAAIIAAAQAAHAHEFILTFPGGYDAPCGENGVQLSGGQKQRIAVARAFLKNAPILLLDEATAALDSASEQAIQEALARLRAGRTTLVIAHRLSTVMDADRICVMEKGGIVEQGTHEELMGRKGAYATMCELQFRRAA
ncbi:MAG: hypothetical protein RLZZ09_3515 [Pseudomonadota bacterium]